MNDGARQIVLSGQGRAFMSGTYQAGVGGQQAGVGFENKAGSGVICAVTSIRISGNGNAFLDFYYATTDFTAGVAQPIINKATGAVTVAGGTQGNVRAGNNAAVLGIFNPAAVIGGPTFVTSGTANSGIEILKGAPIMIPEDKGIMMVTTTAGHPIAVYYEWEELGG